MNIRIWLIAAICISSAILSDASHLTQHNSYPRYTSMYPYNYLSTNERRKAKDLDPIFDNEAIRFSFSVFRASADQMFPCTT